MEWKQNIIEDFKQLVSFDSISFHERKTADWLLARLKSMGFSVEEDQAVLITVATLEIFLPFWTEN